MIDRTDPFNSVVKEKKNFEQKTIDQYVAAGLNKGIDVPPLSSRVFSTKDVDGRY